MPLNLHAAAAAAVAAAAVILSITTVRGQAAQLIDSWPCSQPRALLVEAAASVLRLEHQLAHLQNRLDDARGLSHSRQLELRQCESLSSPIGPRNDSRRRTRPRTSFASPLFSCARSLHQGAVPLERRTLLRRRSDKP